MNRATGRSAFLASLRDGRGRAYVRQSGRSVPCYLAQGLVPLSPCGLLSPLYLVTDRYELVMPPAIKAPMMFGATPHGTKTEFGGRIRDVADMIEPNLLN